MKCLAAVALKIASTRQHLRLPLHVALLRACPYLPGLTLYLYMHASTPRVLPVVMTDPYSTLTTSNYMLNYISQETESCLDYFTQRNSSQNFIASCKVLFTLLSPCFTRFKYGMSYSMLIHTTSREGISIDEHTIGPLSSVQYEMTI